MRRGADVVLADVRFAVAPAVIASANGIQLAYDDVGAGLPLVFLHAFPLDRSMWAPQFGALVGRARCVAPDARGLGASSGRAPYSMDQYADDIASFLDARGVEKAVLCGLSLGGYVIFAFWRRHRDRARALILCDTRAGSDTEEGKQRRRDLIALARAQGAGAVADSMLTDMLSKATREQDAETMATVRAMMASVPVEGMVGALTAMMARPDSTPTLATIDVPALIVVGEDDAPTPPKESAVLHAAIAGSRLEVIPKAGHLSNLEQPTAFNRVVRAFVGAGLGTRDSGLGIGD
jgi:pimeloyl-ACP methyl ester carboxylesterase